MLYNTSRSYAKNETAVLKSYNHHHHQTMAHVKEKLATVGITIFPTRVDDPLWDEIRQSVTPPLTLLEMIALKNESFFPTAPAAGIDSKMSSPGCLDVPRM